MEVKKYNPLVIIKPKPKPRPQPKVRPKPKTKRYGKRWSKERWYM